MYFERVSAVDASLCLGSEHSRVREIVLVMLAFGAFDDDHFSLLTFFLFAIFRSNRSLSLEQNSLL